MAFIVCASMKTQVFQTNHRSGNVLPVLQRILPIVLIVSIQMLYIPTSNRSVGGIEPRLFIDVIPILPIWVVPYVLCYPLWTFAFLWAMLKMEDHLFRSFIAAFLLTCTFSVALFTLFPTYVPEATLIGNDLFTRLLRFIHEDWGRYDALPSGHIYITALLALFYNRWYPRHKNIWIPILVIISLSTLFTGQHYIADVLAGLMIAIIGYYFGIKWAGLSIK
jgi:membrane-associated phospholipid phosphatase